MILYVRIFFSKFKGLFLNGFILPKGKTLELLKIPIGIYMHEADKRNRPLLLSLIISRKSTELYFLPYFIVDNVGLLLSLFNEEIGDKKHLGDTELRDHMHE